MPLTLHWNGATFLPVEAEGLRPDALLGLTNEEVARRTLHVGNTQAEVGDLFRVEGDGSDGQLALIGDLSNVRRLGQGMTSGHLTIRGDVGPHLGAELRGGTIDLFGSAGPWAGAEMRGGLLRVQGMAGDHVGSAYPGGKRGMRGGMILVDGSIGHHAALAMRRGVLAVNGSVGDTLGRHLIAGTIFAFGPIGLAPGLGMKRGTIALFPDEGQGPELLPTFQTSGRFRFPWISLYLRALRERGFPVPDPTTDLWFEKFNGDRVAGGQGEILLRSPGPSLEMNRSRRTRS